MIKLKNGYEIPFNKDFDVFFQDLLESIVRESRQSAASVKQNTAKGEDANEAFLKELMDNCIYVTHQLFDMARDREEFSRFMVTGFIFNSIICTLPALGQESPDGEESGGTGKIH
jgi:hypothetical protein